MIYLYIGIGTFCLFSALLDVVSIAWVLWLIHHAPQEPFPGAWGPLE